MDSKQRNIWKFKKPAKKAPITVGIAGAGPKTGVTHLSVWTANYLKSACGLDTALLEWNDHGDFARIGQFCTRKAGPEFRVLGVDYICCAGAQEWSRCMGKGCGALVADFGGISPENLREYLLCDVKILMGSLTEWQAETFMEALREWADVKRGFQYAVTFGSEELEKEVIKTYGCHIVRIPFHPDPFAVTRQDMKFFEKLLG